MTAYHCLEDSKDFEKNKKEDNTEDSLLQCGGKTMSR